MWGAGADGAKLLLRILKGVGAAHTIRSRLFTFDRSANNKANAYRSYKKYVRAVRYWMFFPLSC